MANLIDLVRTLGPAGATANARRALDASERDEWLVALLRHRLDRAAATRPGSDRTSVAPEQRRHAAG
jgi:hypothetical protein